MATSAPSAVNVPAQSTGAVVNATAPSMPGAAHSAERSHGHDQIAVESDHSLIHTATANEMSLASHKTSFKPGSPVTRLPVELDVAVPVRDFRVRNLLTLAQGQLVETQWSHGDDLPLSSGDVQMAWSEFEVVDTRLAVRITRLA